MSTLQLDLEIKRILAEIYASINESMQAEVTDTTRQALRDAVYTEVYEKYTPKVYIRKMDNGGLSDTSPSIMVANYSATTMTLEVADMRSDKGHLVAPKVEKGTGIMEFIGARPFHKVAERNMRNRNDAEKALVIGLKRRHIDARLGD